MLHFYEPSRSYYEPWFCKSSLTPSCKDAHVPHGMVFLPPMSNKPNLFNYRCVPGGLWLKGNDSGKIIISNSFFFLSNCYVLDTTISNKTALDIDVTILILIEKLRTLSSHWISTFPRSHTYWREVRHLNCAFLTSSLYIFSLLQRFFFSPFPLEMMLGALS